MSEIIDLDLTRFRKQADTQEGSKELPALMVLKDLVREIEAGEVEGPVMMYVAMRTKDELTWRCAGGGRIEYLGLLSRHAHIINEGS